jgi:hypothetical protein
MPIPFQKSIVITYKGNPGAKAMVWLWARGVEDVGLFPDFGLAVDSTRVRLQVQQVVGTFDALTFIDLVSVPAGQQGLVLATQLTLQSANPNVLEGCYYLFPDATATWQNQGWNLLATGTEDYFESAFYFDGGLYAQPYSGVTKREQGPPSKVSAYKIHGPHDPMVFSNGFKLRWRVGDQQDSQGFKCRCPPGTVNCTNAGNPQATTLTSYAWVYTW